MNTDASTPEGREVFTANPIISVNVGDKPFSFEIPEGYRPVFDPRDYADNNNDANSIWMNEKLPLEARFEILRAWSEQQRRRINYLEINQKIQEPERVLMGEEAQEALDATAMRLYSSAATTSQDSLSWVGLPPATKDYWRSQALRTGEFIVITYDANKRILIKARALTVAHVRALLLLDPELDLFIQTHDEAVPGTWKYEPLSRTDVLESSDTPVRLTSVKPS